MAGYFDPNGNWVPNGFGYDPTPNIPSARNAGIPPVAAPVPVQYPMSVIPFTRDPYASLPTQQPSPAGTTTSRRGGKVTSTGAPASSHQSPMGRPQAPASSRGWTSGNEGFATVGWGGSHQWDARKVNGTLTAQADQIYADTVKNGGSHDLALQNATRFLSDVANAPFVKGNTPTKNNNNNGGGGNSAALNALNQMAKQWANNPYQNLLNQLLLNTQNAQQQGNDALSQLKSELSAQANPYGNLKFNTPTAAINPLAAYMSSTGASQDQTNALTQFLGALSQNAVQADTERAKSLGASWDNLQSQRLADANTSQASFSQQLAQQLAQQQGQLDMQRQKYQNDLYQQMAAYAAKYGLAMPAGVQ